MAMSRPSRQRRRKSSRCARSCFPPPRWRSTAARWPRATAWAASAAVIARTCSELTAAIKAGRQPTPASEWLLDNFYLIEEQIRIARRHLPRNYSRQLPLAQGVRFDVI